MDKSPKLILLRHGESEWNRQNIFTGWVDVPLSAKGIEEAIQAGKQISNIPFQVIFVSTLIRAQMTAMIAMSQHRGKKIPVLLHPHAGKLEEWAKINSPEIEETTIPVRSAWELNERMYGDLQGLYKEDIRKKYGEEQFKIWRRSYDMPPPNGESLQMTAERSIPFFEETILPEIKMGRNVLISAHGNSLRSIVMDLEHLSKEEVINLEIPTGIPLCYSYIDGKWQKEEVANVQAFYQNEE